MIKKKIFCLWAAALILSGCAGVFQGKEKETEPDFVLTYAENQAEDYPTTQGADKFAELVKEKTEGKVEILVNAGGILGDEKSVIEQLQFGGIDFARVSISTVAEYIPKFNVLQMPYLYTGADHMWKVLEGDVGTTIKNGLNDYSIQGIGFTDCGSRCFYTTTEVKTIDDFKGLPIRVQNNQLMNSMVSNLGANPVNVAANEVYSALQTGVCKGGENNPNIILSDSLYEVAPYVLMDNHTTTMDVICMNLDLWES